MGMIQTGISLMCMVLLLAACAHPIAPVVDRNPAARPHVAGPPAQATPSPSLYRVRRGDTLHSIAWRYGLDFRRLADWNHIDPPYRIYVGQALRMKPPPHEAAVRHPPKKTGSATTKENKAKQGVASKSRKKKRKQESRRALHWIWPVKGRVVHRFARNDRYRRGVKIKGHYGQPVKAAESGTVVYVGNNIIGYGNLVIIDHPNDYISAYGYNSRILVREGQKVQRGQTIAEMGEDPNGRPVLYFEIRHRSTAVNPIALLR